jgi:CRISPR-associated endonuclease/helicase Cas3
MGDTRRDAWGKTDANGVPTHHLVHHSMDVAAVLERLLAHPILSRRVDAAAGRPLGAEERIWLAAFAFLHDVGKLSPGFQAKAWPSEAMPKGGRHGHLTEGGLWFDRLLEGNVPLMTGAAEALIEPLFDAGERVVENWVRILLAHHGRPVPATEIPRPSDPLEVFRDVPGYDWRAEDAAMGAMLRRWFPDARIGRDIVGRPPLLHLFAGLLALADWIGSDEAVFRHTLPLDPSYDALARERAETALIRIGLFNAPWPERTPTFADLTGHATPRGAQAAISEVPLDARLAIVEAETGAGKTEAALLRFVTLRAAGLVDSLYFAVPTRAAASQLHARIVRAMDRIGGPEPVLAVPGMLRAGQAEGQRLPGFRVLWDDDRARWAAEHPTRFLAASIAVGTIDQALMAALRVKHAPLRAAALSRSLLVIDEVHASDAYMNAVARPLVRDHVALGGHALLMSATLGSAQRAAWLGTPPASRTTAEATPYPAIWHANEPDVPIRPETDNREKRVRPILVPTMDAGETATRAILAAERGARVLLIRNTVDMAIATWRAVADPRPELCLELDGGPALHHARFAAEDRIALDAAVEATLGKKSPDRGVIVIGTQTLEQSLDIDADLLITDLCPMDVLLQRIGRLHRHERASRPAGFEAPTVLVMAPEGGLARLAAGPSFENGLGAWKDGGGYTGIYLDLRIVERTRARVEADTVWTLPADNRRLVEDATHAEALAETEAMLGWDAYGLRIDAKGLAEGRAGAVVVLDRGAPFPTAFPDLDEAVQTRLGTRGPSFALPTGTRSPLGQTISTLSPPAHWCRGLTGEETVAVEADAEALILAMGDRTFRYGRDGLARTDVS